MPVDYERYVLPQPFYADVNVYRFGETLVDTGHMASVSVAALHEAVPVEQLERVVITHPHVDHMGGSLVDEGLSTLPHVGLPGTKRVMRDPVAELRAGREEMAARVAGISGSERTWEQWDTYFPVDREYLGGHDFEVVADGETVVMDGVEYEVVHTPGHSAHHMALFDHESRTLVSADVVSESGHFDYGIRSADIGAYRDSLQRIRLLDPDRLLPGHGDPVSDVDARIDDALEKVHTTERKLRDAVEYRGQAAAHDLAADVFGATGDQLAFFTLVTSAFLDHLDETGALTVEQTDEGPVASAD